MKRTGLWNNLERWVTPATVLVEWRAALDGEFALAKTFLRGTDEPAEEYPCQHQPQCGCQHEVIHHSTDRIVAACCCDERGCKTFPLRLEEILIHELDGRKLCMAIRGACGFEPPPEENARIKGATGAWAVGTYGDVASPVHLTIRQKEQEFLSDMEALVNSGQGEPFIVLAPTDRHLTPTVRTLLNRHRCAFIPLSRHLDWDGAGKLKEAGVLRAVLERFSQSLMEGKGLVKTVEKLGRDIETIAKGNYELRKENEELRRLAAEGYLKFVRAVEPLDFCCFVFILAYGDRAKAARKLEMKERKFYLRVESWATRGADYRRMFSLVKCRKTALCKGSVPLGTSLQSGGIADKGENPDTIQAVLDRIQEGSIGQLDYPKVLQDILDALVEMNAKNWPKIRTELVEIIREEVPQ